MRAHRHRICAAQCDRTDRQRWAGETGRTDGGSRAGEPAAAVGAAGLAGPPIPVGPLWIALLVAGRSALALARVHGRMRRVSADAHAWRSSSSRCWRRRSRCIRRCWRTRPKPRSGWSRRVRAAGGEPARRSAAAAAARRSSRSTRFRRSTNLLRLDGATPATDRAFRRLVAHRPGDLPADVGGRAVSAPTAGCSALSRSACRNTRRPQYRAAGCSWDEPFDEVSPFGSSERHVLRTSRGVCVRGRIGRQHRRARDARLPDAAVHLVAEPVSRVAAAEPAGRRRKACRAATSSSRSTAGAARRSSSRARASGRCPTRCSSGWSSRASRSGRRSIATARRSASTS